MGPPVNEKILAQEVRLIGADAEQLGVYHLPDALKLAREAGLDLVEVASKSQPPVCRIMDYGKYKYEQKKKKHGTNKQTVHLIKEIKLRPKIEQHDFDFKVDRIRRFLNEGHKVKVTLVFRGREMAHQDLGRQVLTRALEAVKEDGAVEFMPKMEGRMVHAVVAPTQAARTRAAKAVKEKNKAKEAAREAAKEAKHSDENSGEKPSDSSGEVSAEEPIENSSAPEATVDSP